MTGMRNRTRLAAPRLETSSQQTITSKTTSHLILKMNDAAGGQRPEVDKGRTRAQTLPSSHWTLMVIFVSLLVDLLGFTVILPLMPSLLEYYSKHDESGVYASLIQKVDGFRMLIGAPDTQRFNLVLLGGLLGSLFSLLQFLVSPIIGASSDLFGRKPVLLIGMAGVALSYAIWAVSHNFTLFILARIIGGVFKGNISLSTAIVADVTTKEKRSKGMALIGVAFSLGFLFGPMIGAYFSILGKREGSVASFSAFQYPALFSLTLAVIDFVFLVAAFQETLPSERRADSLGHGIMGTVHLINPVSLFKFDALNKISSKDLSNLRLMSAAYFLYLFLFSGLEYSLTFLVHQRFHYTSMDQGKMFLFIGIAMILVQGGYLRRRPPGTEKPTAVTGILAIIPGMLLVGFSHSSYMLYSGLLLYSFGAGTVVPSLTSIASKFGEGDEKGKVMGIFRSLGALARALGPSVACGSALKLHTPSLPLVAHVFLTSSIVSIFGSILVSVYWNYSACVCYMTGGLLLLVPMLMLMRVNLEVTKND